MGRRALSLLAGMLILASMPEPVLADSVVDQANPAHVTSFGGTRTFAQTVTVGLSGILTGVDLYLSSTAETKITASITSLYRGSGLPFGPALASATVQVSSQTWYHFEFPVPVTFLSGGRFAIVFPVVQGSAKGSSGGYSRGQALEYGAAWAPLNGDANLDFAFRTYMIEPTPMPTANPTAEPVPMPTAGADSAPTAAPTAGPTAAPTAGPTVGPASTASPVATPTTSPSMNDVASPTASIAAGTPSALQDPQSGGAGESGGPPILLIVVGIVALAAVLGGIGLVFARRRRRGSQPDV